MDERLLEHYNTELRHLREMAGEFANEFPKLISARASGAWVGIQWSTPDRIRSSYGARS